MGKTKNFSVSLKRLSHVNRYKLFLGRKKDIKSVKKKKKTDKSVSGHRVKKQRSPWKVENLAADVDDGAKDPQIWVPDVSLMDEVDMNGSCHFRAPSENPYYNNQLLQFGDYGETDSDAEDLDTSFADYETSHDDESDVLVVDELEPAEQNGADEDDDETNGTDEDDNETNEEEEDCGDDKFYREEDDDEMDEAQCTSERCKFYALDDEVFALAISRPLSIAIRGQIRLKVILGKIEIGGYIVDTRKTDYISVSSIDRLGVYSISVMQCNVGLNFETFRKELMDCGATKEVVRSLSNVAGAVVLFRKHCDRIGPYLEYVYREPIFRSERDSLRTAWIPSESYGCSFSYRLKGRIMRTPRWRVIRMSIIDYIRTNSEPPRILVCGEKRVGKSTFCRYLANCLLNVTSKLSWLDCDPGQTEFTPPGLLSLVDVNEPLLGPPFTHHKKPNVMFFAGGVSAADLPTHYVKCMQKLIEYRNEKKCHSPLIVNTMGWTNGVGLTILADIYNLVKPTHVINIASSIHRSTFPDLTLKYMSTVTGWQFGVPQLNYPSTYFKLQATCHRSHSFQAKLLRDIGLVTYLGQLQNKEGPFHPINECPCYRVSWSSVAIHICHKSVPFSEMLYVYNGNIVALCHCDPQEIVTTPHPTFPKFLKTTPVVDCFGYGIIRAISMKEECFYVMTSVSVGLLSRTNVLLVGCGLNIPIALTWQQSVKSHIPYLTVHRRDSRYDVLDEHAQQIRVRVNRATYSEPSEYVI